MVGLRRGDGDRWMAAIIVTLAIVPIVPPISPVPQATVHKLDRGRSAANYTSANACASACRERCCYVWTASQAHPDFPRLRYPTVAHRFLLALIGQAVAVPAGE
jgi:hypothetical protein